MVAAVKFVPRERNITSAPVNRDLFWKKIKGLANMVSQDPVFIQIFAQIGQLFLTYSFLIMFLISVHPCDRRNKGGCSQICNRKDDRLYTCSCKPGFEIAKNKMTCNKGRMGIYIVCNIFMHKRANIYHRV